MYSTTSAQNIFKQRFDGEFQLLKIFSKTCLKIKKTRSKQQFLGCGANSASECCSFGNQIVKARLNEGFCGVKTTFGRLKSSITALKRAIQRRTWQNSFSI
jgi:hypothetical protein